MAMYSTGALAVVVATLVSQPPAELRVPAYTAYLVPDANAASVRSGRSVSPFVQPGETLVWYGNFGQRGTMSAAVTVRMASTDVVRLRLVVGASHRDAMATPRAGEGRVDFGRFVIADTGYQRIELQAVGGRIAPGLEVGALLLTGVGAVARFNVDARRNAASVHLNFPVDSTLTVTGFYNEVTAVDDPVHTFYEACGFARGYFGMQVNSSTERRIIFSVWDAASGATANDRSTVAKENHAQLLAKGDGVVAEVFGNEGTGGHSHLVYPWVTGSTQRFYVTAEPEGAATVYTGYWFHPERGRWMLIASFRAPKDGRGLRRLYAFSENFEGSTGNLRRKAFFGAQWIRLSDGTWRELTTATFSHDPTGKANRLDRFMGIEEGRFYLSHGGFGPGYTAYGVAFTRPATGKPPEIALPER
jgi:Domain of unknown function (DUF3472)/Domain of unknown function (DUF5077)